jgi:hypothetical protein
MGSNEVLRPENPGNLDLTQDEDQKWSPVAENWPVQPADSPLEKDGPETEATNSSDSSDEDTVRQDDGFITLDNPDPKPD